MGFRVWGLGFRVWGLGLGVWGFRGLGFSRSEVSQEFGASGLRVLGFRALGPQAVGLKASGYLVQARGKVCATQGGQHRTLSLIPEP